MLGVLEAVVLLIKSMSPSLNLRCFQFLLIIPSYGTLCLWINNNNRNLCEPVMVAVFPGCVVFSRECPSWVVMVRGLVMGLSLFILASLLVAFGCWFVECCDRVLWCRRAISTGDGPSWFVSTFKFLRSCGVSAPRVCLMTFRSVQCPMGDASFADDLGEETWDQSTVLHQHVPDTRCRYFAGRSSLVEIYSPMFYVALFYVVVFQKGSSENHGTGM